MTRAQLYDIVKPEFRDLIHENLSLTRISSGHVWTEGPVWFPAHKQLLFSDIPNQRLCRWTPDGGTSVFRTPSNFANGNTRDLQGRLVTCQHGTRSVVRTEHDGSQKVIADSHDGKRLNSPNDVIVHSDGSIWFSDPTYGILSDLEGSRADPEQEGNFVYRVAPDGQGIRPVATDFVQPNGLAFSRDESRLYVAESGSSHDASVPSILKVYDVMSDGALANVCDFSEIDNGLPDGLRVDQHDNLWCSANDGVHIFAPTGDLIGKVLVPERVANLTFGGERGNVLFITATTSVYSVFVNTGAS
ncbi:SMP-30/gluconolactonase/LRE family protein [Shimia sp. R9_3]|uniref:SMP-30/gluconolactonase/LRE family protein n=1 Tax=Shimia sp. R9_3 TaxID=2821113 RepID=UPI001ADB01EB|nr:SMP-30/gluconolactonase/LRE family protein [Shimia sp. R9_3]MBO9402928.1 SMP-30/gluconolactonase/LRE family protein [Shimia sp. R9_3]